MIKFLIMIKILMMTFVSFIKNSKKSIAHILGGKKTFSLGSRKVKKVSFYHFFSTL